jgi:hypothetical protein
MATPGFAQVTTVDGYDTTGLAINKHATAVTGQGLLVFLAKENDDPVDPPAGWTELGSGAVTDPDPDDDTPLALHCFWKRVGGSDDLYSFTWQEPCYARILLARFTGVASSGSFIDVYDADDNSTLDDETPAVSVTTTGSNRLIVWCATNYWGGSWTMPSNYTSRSPRRRWRSVHERSRRLDPRATWSACARPNGTRVRSWLPCPTPRSAVADLPSPPTTAGFFRSCCSKEP